MTISVPQDGRLRLLSYRGAGGDPRIGAALADGSVLDIADAASAAGIKPGFDPSSMISLIESGVAGIDAVRKLAASGGRNGLTIAENQFLPPIPRLTKNIYCVGWNYVEHFQEGAEFRADPNLKLPDHPVFFSKGVNSLNGPFDPIPYDTNVSNRVDWEVELAVVIGKKGRNISEAGAMGHVFGYTVLNDTSAREVQQKKHGGQWFKGKSLDGHAPMGPWIVPASDLDPSSLHLLCRINGDVRQDGSTRQMYFKVPRIIAELSLGLTLEPGDVIATGTPPGVGFAMKPPQYLKPGDIMESEIVEIGAIRNTIAAV